jgi:hypothetical protein
MASTDLHGFWLVVVLASLALVGQVLLPGPRRLRATDLGPCLEPRALGSPRL